MVIPKAFRERAGFEPGMELDIRLSDDGVLRISAPAREGEVVYRDGLPYWRAGRKITAEEIDKAIQEAREEREQRIIRGLAGLDEDCS